MMQHERLSPMSVKCEDDAPEMQLSPMQSEHGEPLQLPPLGKESDMKFSYEDRPYGLEGMEPMCEL